MIDHISTYATDYDATRAFYDAVFPTLGFSVQVEMTAAWNPEWPTQRMCAFGPEGRPIFWIMEVAEADKATPRHIAFSAATHAAVHAWYDAGLGAGGTDNGAPGPRPHYSAHYYGGFLLDPDGNNVEACCHRPE